MEATYQSEIGKIKSVLLKPVAQAFVDQATIGQQWRDLNFLHEPVVTGIRKFQAVKSNYLERG